MLFGSKKDCMVASGLLAFALAALMWGQVDQIVASVVKSGVWMLDALAMVRADLDPRWWVVLGMSSTVFCMCNLGNVRVACWSSQPERKTWRRCCCLR